MLFSVCLLGYGLLGYLLTAQFNLIDGDGPSRVANAGYTILSRNPHLGAMGFVWNPLPSLVELPLLGFSHWWPELKTLGLAAVIQSALFMAGAAVGVRRIAFDRDVPRLGRWAAVAAFAANPMIVQYGAVGLSEAALIFCVVWSVRYLLLWVQSGLPPASPGRVSRWGSAISRGTKRSRRSRAGRPSCCCSPPTVRAIRAGWDASRRGGRRSLPESRPRSCSAFPRWAPSCCGRSRPGCSPGCSAAVHLPVRQRYSDGHRGKRGCRPTRREGDDRLDRRESVRDGAVAARSRRRRGVVRLPSAASRYLRALAVCGGVLAFQAAAQYTGMTFGWFRFYILVVPMTVIAAMTLWEPLRSRETGGSMRACASSVAASALMVATLVSSIPVTWHSMLNPAIGDQGPQQGLRSMVWPDRYPPQENSLFQAFQDDRNIARWLDNQNLPPSSVLSDTFQSWGIWLASGRPRQFVITSDFDFARALNAPHEFGIRFILVSDPVADGAADAVNRRYPTLWSDGAGLGELQLTVTGPGGQPRWKIYRLDG